MLRPNSEQIFDSFWIFDKERALTVFIQSKRYILGLIAVGIFSLCVSLLKEYDACLCHLVKEFFKEPWKEICSTVIVQNFHLDG